MKLWTVVALALLGIAAASSASSAEGVDVGVDSVCDCDDVEALFYKNVRQFSQYSAAKKDDGAEEEDEEGEESVNIDVAVKKFLKDFKIKPVCGSDGIFYKSRCELQCTRARAPKPDLKEKKRWRCRRKGHLSRGNGNKSGTMERMAHTKVCICPRHYIPVCASNGVTYGNMCTFGCARDNVDPEIKILKEGKCNDDDKTFIH